MSGDTIVLRIQDQMSENSDNINGNTRMYILYDHEYDTFLIRGKCLFKSDTKHNKWSYYCDDKNQVQNMLSMIYKDFHTLCVSLRNYSNLPKDSDEITLDLLDKMELGEGRSIISIFDYIGEPGKTPDVSYSKYLDILVNMYNNWV
jgi:hypothetical protein